MMDSIQTIFFGFFDVNSVWSIVARAIFWFGIAMVIITTTGGARPERSIKKLKSNLGMFLMFVVLSSSLIYFLFGFSLS